MVTHYHPQACVESEKVGSHTIVRAFTRIYGRAEIGRNCKIGDHCCIENDVRIGREVIVGHGVCLPAGVTVEDRVRIGSHVTFFDETPYEARAGGEWPPRTLIGEGAQLGDGTTVRCGVTVGRHARIDPGSLVMEDVPDFARVGGSPARQSGWLCACGEPLDLAPDGDGQATCPCGRSYTMSAGRVAGDHDVAS